MSAPMELRKFARSTICGSFAAFSIMLKPFAFTAASIAFIVAPTETTSRYIWLPLSESAVTSTIPWSIEHAAPRAENAFRCWSMGRSPRGQPPGIETLALLNFPSSAPKK